MCDVSHHYILVTGWMGSGKSTLLREYDHAKLDFLTPEGLRSDFFDVSFGLDFNGCKHYYYELDSPTVLGAAWIDYVKIAEGVIIVYDLLAGERYGTLRELGDFLLSNTQPQAPILMVANKAEDDQTGLELLNEAYPQGKLRGRTYAQKSILRGEPQEDAHGLPHLVLDPEQVSSIFTWMSEAVGC